MRYLDSHEWIAADGKVGITAYAQKELGHIVYIDLPKVGQTVRAKEETCVLESTKAAVDIYSPVSGTVVSVNELLVKDPDLINRAPEEAGWLFQVALSDLHERDRLLTYSEYQKIISS